MKFLLKFKLPGPQQFFWYINFDQLVSLQETQMGVRVDTANDSKLVEGSMESIVDMINRSNE